MLTRFFFLRAPGQWSPIAGTIFAILGSVYLLLAEAVTQERESAKPAPSPVLEPMSRRMSLAPGPGPALLPPPLTPATATTAASAAAAAHRSNAREPYPGGPAASSPLEHPHLRRAARGIIRASDWVRDRVTETLPERPEPEYSTFPETPGENLRNAELHHVRTDYSVYSGVPAVGGGDAAGIPPSPRASFVSVRSSVGETGAGGVGGEEGGAGHGHHHRHQGSVVSNRSNSSATTTWLDGTTPPSAPPPRRQRRDTLTVPDVAAPLHQHRSMITATPTTAYPSLGAGRRATDGSPVPPVAALVAPPPRRSTLAAGPMPTAASPPSSLRASTSRGAPPSSSSSSSASAGRGGARARSATLPAGPGRDSTPPPTTTTTGLPAEEPEMRGITRTLSPAIVVSLEDGEAREGEEEGRDHGDKGKGKEREEK